MITPDRIRVASAQYPIDAPATVTAWRDKLNRWVAEGAASGAQLLVFPEYGAMEVAACASPAVAGDLIRSLAWVADTIPEVDAAHRDLARRHGVLILAASGPMRRDGRYVNAARLFTPAGGVGIVEKQIMTPFERAWGIAPGAAGGTVFDTALGRIGVAICYDSEFPLLVRAQAEAGADLVVIPSCTERQSGWSRVRAAAMARALESQIATVVSPTVGEALWSPAVDRNTGAAGIYVPPEQGLSETGVLAEGTLNTPQWVVADIDLAAIRRIRTAGEMRNDTDWRAQPGAAPLADHVTVVAIA